MLALSAIVLYPGALRRPAPLPPIITVPPTPDPVTCWDDVQRIANGYSTPMQWYALNGVWRQIKAVVWHDMEGSLAGSIARWNLGVAGAHLCVLRSGRVVLTCDLGFVAWHAGTTAVYGSDTYGRTDYWRRNNINPYSVGVELEGFVATGYTPEQVSACVRIARFFSKAPYDVPLTRTFDQIAGHHLHSEISAMRSDPGNLFPVEAVLEAARLSA